MLDPSFRSDLPLRGFVSIVLQNDQKIIVVSDIQASGLRNQQILRLNGDGSVDETFTSPFGPELALSAMVCQRDGKLVVAGRFSTNPPVAADEIKRLLPSGALDPNFAASTGTNGWIRSILAQQDGKIWIAGQFQQVNGIPRYGLARLNPSGTLDQSFELKTNAFATGPIAMQADGKIIFNATFAPTDSDVMWDSMLRSALDGSIDSSFSSELHGILRNIAIQSDGRILAAGELFTKEGRRYALDRLLSDGSADPEFHQTRFVSNGDAWTMTTQPDNKILVAGLFEDVNGKQRRNLARLNSDGSLDTLFDPGVALPGFATSIALQADSNVLVSGGVFTNPDSIQGFVIRVTGDRALRFQNVTQDAGGPVRFRILNGTGKPWVLQGSSNLMHWSNLTTNLTSNNVSTDSDASLHQRRFYRAFVP